jgi:hypothetical protein
MVRTFKKMRLRAAYMCNLQFATETLFPVLVHVTADKQRCQRGNIQGQAVRVTAEKARCLASLKVTRAYYGEMRSMYGVNHFAIWFGRWRVVFTPVLGFLERRVVYAMFVHMFVHHFFWGGAPLGVVPLCSPRNVAEKLS